MNWHSTNRTQLMFIVFGTHQFYIKLACVLHVWYRLWSSFVQKRRIKCEIKCVQYCEAMWIHLDLFHVWFGIIDSVATPYRVLNGLKRHAVVVIEPHKSYCFDWTGDRSTKVANYAQCKNPHRIGQFALLEAFLLESVEADENIMNAYDDHWNPQQEKHDNHYLQVKNMQYTAWY